MKLRKPLIVKAILLPIIIIYLILITWVADAMFRRTQAPILIHDKIQLIFYHVIGFFVFFLMLLLILSQAINKGKKGEQI